MCAPQEQEDEKEEKEIPHFEGQVIFKGNFDRSHEPTPLPKYRDDER